MMNYDVNMMNSWGAMMTGWGSFWFFIFALGAIVWLIVGVLAIAWLWKEISKK